ncbi:uncharacterized protein LOC127421497 [Myxocyprinus asiaticus]|uniref:uncharacterized protein LOC127421497 n=1 Tax=Myxocyprinus asiaticus TaxID=70543 RepID=UPI002222BF77|nr:uncharacterized protein LOC127421497 [Myxocyprinus asiaticus]XP_051520539.1 uncharacterized protein LOC127421497 [Myxocyprinus asiaticus]
MKTGSPEQCKEEFLSLADKDAVDLCGIADFVERKYNSTVPLVKPKNCTLRICGQHGTVYAGDEEQLEAWKDFYLPERMEMEVIGAIDNFPCDAFGLQLVLLLCKDGKVYAYEDEVLHLVAMSLKDLFQCGMVFPGKETFKLGEYFEEPTEEEYNEMMECDDIKAMKESHQKFRESMECELLNTMNNIKQSRNAEEEYNTVMECDGFKSIKKNKETLSNNVYLNMQKKQWLQTSVDLTSSTDQKIQDSELQCKCNMKYVKPSHGYNCQASQIIMSH